MFSASVAIPVSLEGELGDSVWFDSDGDGVRGDAEPGVSGVTVRLLDSVGTTLQTTTTNEDGEYFFLVSPGSYRVQFVAPAQRAFTTRSVGIPSLDSDADAAGLTDLITIGAAEDQPNIDAGLIEFIAAPDISIQTSTNGVDSDDAPGEELTVGRTATISYVVSNAGNTVFTDVVVTDDLFGAIACPQETLGVGESITCTETVVVVEGAVAQVGSVRARAVEPDGDVISSPFEASDPTHHVGFVPEPAITLEKATNGDDADEQPGPTLQVGDDVTFTFTVENVGNVDLIDVVVTDDQLGAVCDIARLTVDETTRCAIVSVVTSGPHVTVGSVTGTPLTPDGLELDAVSDSDLSHYVAGPVCETTIGGVRMHRNGGPTIDETGYFAAPGSTIRIVTFEPGLSPKQDNEQVYVMVGDELHGPTPAGLGELIFVTENGGAVTILHYSELHPDINAQNSVEYTWCGNNVSLPTVHACPNLLVGPLMIRNQTTVWEPGVSALPGAELFFNTFENGGSPHQPNEQVYIQVGDELFGPTPAGLGDLTFTVDEGGPITVLHYSELHDDAFSSNSVHAQFCGTGLMSNGR